MKRFLAFLLWVSVHTNGIELSFDQYKHHWQEWKAFYGKSYGSEAEQMMRFAVWKKNLKFIQLFNSERHSHNLGMNQFGDMTFDEYRFNILSYRHTMLFFGKEHNGSTLLPAGGTRFPRSVDWRSKGYVTRVKDQGILGRSWPFSVTGAVEGQHFKKTGKLVSLSEQNLVDCSGCYMDEENHFLYQAVADCGFEYIIRNGGIDTESGYPDPCNKSCCFLKDKVGATVTGYVDLQRGSELALHCAVATVGPIAIAIDAGQPSFQFYRSGVYDDPDCSSTELDHAVLVVGYGIYQGKEYWLVKNSWGTSWGMEGYIMMSRNKNNQCGIASSASYPLV